MHHIQLCLEIKTISTYLEVLLLCVSSILAVLVSSSSSSSFLKETIDFKICTLQLGSSQLSHVLFFFIDFFNFTLFLYRYVFILRFLHEQMKHKHALTCHQSQEVRVEINRLGNDTIGISTKQWEAPLRVLPLHPSWAIPVERLSLLHLLLSLTPSRDSLSVSTSFTGSVSKEI